MQPVVPLSSLVFCLISLLLSVGLPVALCIFCVKKGGRGMLRTVLVGAFCFIVGALVLEQICHAAVMALLPALREQPLAFGAYAALAAGVFEETARLLGLRWLCKRDAQPLTGFAYGVGHGGIEAVIIGGWGAFSNLYVLFTLRTAGVSAMLASYPAEQQTAVQMQLDTLLALDPSLFLASGLERLVAICFHIALSIIIYMVVTKRLPFYGYFAAVLLHAGMDCFAVAYQMGAITNIWLLEGLMGIMTAVVCFVVFKVWQTYKEPPVRPL